MAKLTGDYQTCGRLRVRPECIGSDVENRESADGLAVQRGGNSLQDGLLQGLVRRWRSIARSDDDIRTEGAELGGETAFGVDLKIEERGSDGGTRAEREENH